MIAPTVQRLPGLAALLALLLATLLAQSYSGSKDIWYDEVWTFFVSQHDVPLWQIVRERWLTDIHPPLFYAISWMAKPLTGDSIIAARAINVAALLGAVGSIAMMARRIPGVSGFAATYGLAMAGSHHFVAQMIEHRSYFLSLSASAVLSTGLYAVTRLGRDYVRNDRWLLAMIGIAAVIALNLHYLATVAAAVVGGCFIISFAMSGHRGWAVRLALAYGLAGALVCGWFLGQRYFVTQVAAHFWADTTPYQAALTFYWFARMMIEANPALSLLALVGLAGFGMLDQAERRFAWTACAGLVFAALAFLLINAAVPSLQARYLASLQPPALAVIAALAAPRVASSRFWLILGFAGFLVGLGLTAKSPVYGLGWTTAARAARAVQQGCPDAAVHARPYWKMNPDVNMGLALEPRVTRYGEELVASQVGLRLEPEGSRRVSAQCPTVVMAVHIDGSFPAETVARRAILPIDRAVLGSARTERLGRNFITVFPSAAKIGGH